MTEMARTTVAGKPLRKRARFYTEGTQFDVYKNRDVLPLCRDGGLSAIWFGIEDIVAELVNKGQDAGRIRELFSLMHSLGIEPNAMMIHSDEQPLRSPRGDLAGVVNQAKYLFRAGAVSYQCTYLGPAIGTRDIEKAAEARMLYKRVGGELTPQAFQDGNHVIASRSSTPWERQMNVVRAYAAFYNPLNAMRVAAKLGRSPLAPKRLLFQLIGHIGLAMTAPKLWRWARKLKRGPIEPWDGLQQARIPMVNVKTGREMNWAIEQVATPGLPDVASLDVSPVSDSDAETPASVCGAPV